MASSAACIYLFFFKVVQGRQRAASMQKTAKRFLQLFFDEAEQWSKWVASLLTSEWAK
jgi:hypothetical protein